MNTVYKVVWSNGVTEYGFATLSAAEEAVCGVLSGAVIGHDGDIADGGERTLFWASEELAADDDGSRAAGAIVASHEEVITYRIETMASAGPSAGVWELEPNGDGFETREEAERCAKSLIDDLGYAPDRTRVVARSE
jgi:hypothetical protein